MTHTYSASGSYVVTLTATGPSGAPGTVSRTINVLALAKPTADFSYSPTAPTVFQ